MGSAVHQGNGTCREPGGDQRRFDHQPHDGLGRGQRIAADAEHDGVAAAQHPAGVGQHVGAAFEDESDDAESRADHLHVEFLMLHGLEDLSPLGRRMRPATQAVDHPGPHAVGNGQPGSGPSPVARVVHIYRVGLGDLPPDRIVFK